MDVGLFLYFPLYLIAVFLAFYIPGNIFIARLRLTGLQKVTLSFTFGLVLWALQGFLFGFLHVRWMTYLYLLAALFIWMKVVKPKFKSKRFKFSKPKKNMLLGLFITIAVISQLSMAFANGITTQKGIYFCCGLPDSISHIAITNELVTNFPPHEPGVSGVMLNNYHFLANLTNADLIRIFHIPLLYLQYPYTTLLITILLALNVLIFAQLVIKNKLYSFWIIFFVFFSGDLLYILILLTKHSVNFQNSFLETSAALWISPPRVYGAAIFFAGLSFLTLWITKRKNLILDVLIAATFGSLIGFKVYFGIFGLIGLAFLALLYLRQKEFRKVVTCISALIISVGLFLPIDSGAGGFIFTGFWRFENFAANSNFGLAKMELARYVYLQHGNFLHATLNDLIYFFVFFIFIFGTLLISLFQTKKSLSLIDKKINLFLISGLIFSFILGSFFIQKTGGANSSQFIITDMILLPIYTALALYYWSLKFQKRKWIVVLLSLIIIVFTIPRVIYENAQSLLRIVNHKGLLINNNELSALDYLKTNTLKNSVILQYNINSCEYFSFLADRYPYVCKDGAPSDRGVKLTSRIKLQMDVFKYGKRHVIAQLPHEHIVQYAYMPTAFYRQKQKIFRKSGYIKKYSNNEITILKVF